jgi:hypothetical protein
MVKRTLLGIGLLLSALTVAGFAVEPQTILRAFAPAESSGQSVILQIDWAQVKRAIPEVNHVSLRRRPAGHPVPIEKIGVLSTDQARLIDSVPDAGVAYHYYAYFKDADSTTLRFGSYPAIVYLGPINTTPGH